VLTRAHPAARRGRGFSLIELAIGLVIVAVLLSSLLVPLVTQVDQRRTAEAQRLLEDARNALIGFAAANGRLPCPAVNASNGAESPAGGGACTSWVGFLPAATLGLTPVDPQGFQTDPFGNQSNRLRYAVSDANIGSTVDTFTTTSTATTGMRGATMASIAASTGLLRVCSTASSSATSCSAGVPLANGTAIAVVYSIGKNGILYTEGTAGDCLAPGATCAGISADETENVDMDRVFVSRPPSETAGAEFDDMLVWISPSMLFGRLIAAGQQP
jgi:prepilin-type N-terminal cleavage/methylation domain-containing protein